VREKAELHASGTAKGALHIPVSLIAMKADPKGPDFDKRFANQISTNYPPYNVVKKSEDDYEIQIAVSGFEKSEVTVEVNRDQLIIKGEHADAVVDNVEYLHRGLASRDFTRAFTLAEHMEVGDAVIRNGILTISLTRIVPEELKPRLISIKEVV
jgi:molecular chaperone IbpA